MSKSMLSLSIAAVAILVASSAHADTLITSSAYQVIEPHFLQPPTGSIVLYDQIDAGSGTGAPMQNFEAAHDGYDSEGADDFIVPAQGWTLTGVNLVTQIGAPAGYTTASIGIHPDDGGKPAETAACAYASASARIDEFATSIYLPTPCPLDAGTYWIVVQGDINLAFNGQIFWSNRTIQTHHAAVWRNPGNDFATGCTSFAPMSQCGVGGSSNPDFLFQIIGAPGLRGVPAAPPSTLPTLGQWGALLVAGGLALLGILALRRRAQR